MTTEMARQALTSFARDQRPAAMALTGPWGSGKTWMWNSVIRALASESSPPFRRYAYVSLFGLNSVAELKAALFENAVPPAQVAGGATTSTWRDGMNDVLDSATVSEGAKKTGKAALWGGRRHAQHIAPLLPSWGPTIRSATFLAVRNYVVCIDDVERKGAGLSMTEVLGLVSHLKEQRDCRVILILNEDGFGPEGKAEKDRFSGFREKALDREIVFMPTPKECAHLVFADKSGAYALAAGYAVRLGITNIRILQRVSRLLDDLLPAFNKAREAVIQSLVHSATLLAWCFYGEAGGAPTYAFVRNLSPGSFVGMGDEGDTTPVEKAWLETLFDYEFNVIDDLDQEVCRTLENGYVDAGHLVPVVQDANERADAELAFGSMAGAWDLLRNTFEDNTNEFTATLVRTATANARWVRYFDAEAVCHVLRTLGKDAEATAFASHWVHVIEAINPGRLKRPDGVYTPGVRDDIFRNMADSAVVARTKRPTLSDTIRKLAHENGWSQIDEDVLSAADLEDYVRVFRNATGDSELNSYVRACLKFGGLSHGNPTYQRIAVTVSDALRQLAAGSPINAFRVSRFTLYDAEPPKPPVISPPNPFIASDTTDATGDA